MAIAEPMIPDFCRIEFQVWTYLIGLIVVSGGSIMLVFFVLEKVLRGLYRVLAWIFRFDP